MSLSYKKLFSVQMSHNFYADGITRDFDIVPTPETAAILKNNKLLFRMDETGFRVMYRTLDGSPSPFFPLGNFDLRFSLTLKANPAFIIVTDLAQTTPVAKDFVAGNLAYFSNAANVAVTNLPYKIIDQLKSTQFTYTFPQTTVAAQTGSKINIKNEANVDVTPTNPDPLNVPAVLDQSVPPTVYKYLYPVDFGSQPAGLFTFHTEVATQPNEDRLLYLDNSLATRGCFGLIRININGGSFPIGIDYTTKFFSKLTDWRYIVVLKSDATNTIPPANFRITDNGSVVAPYTPPYVFTNVGTTTVNGVPAAIIESQSAIPFFEIPKKGLDISHINPVTDVKQDADNPSRLVVSMGGTNNDKSQIYVFV